MKNIKLCLILAAIPLAVLSAAAAQADPIRVAMYVDEGVGTSYLDVIASMADPSRFDVAVVSGADVRAGALRNFDLIIHPGGSGSGQAASLEESGRDSVRAFVRDGGGYLGICAGSYLASADYSWSLYLLNTKVIDRAHWDRGYGSVDVRFNSFGRDLFGLAQDTIVLEYRQGALMAPAGNPDLPGYVEVGVFESEIAENGAPSGVMIGTTAFAFSVYGEGRVAAFSPHPEISPGYEHLIPDAVEWLVSDEPFLAVVTPRELDNWEAGSIRTIEWVSESDGDPVAITFSPDNGATWQPVASGVTEPYAWTVPATPAAECLLRVESLVHAGMAYTVPFAITPPPPSITSLRGGNWSDPGTWEGGVVPGAADNVVIGAGHTVIVDAPSACLDISFADAAGRLGLEENLSIHGSFNRYDTAVNPFYSGSNLWVAGAKMIFTGTALVQTITNLGTTSTSPYPCRFQEIVVDKMDGKFTTNPVDGLESGYRLGIGTSLEIVIGTFELGRADDIEGRTVAGTASTPTITVQEGGVFRMLGSSSHIRRGNFIGDDTSKIGKMTVHGAAYLASSTTNRVSFTGIDIEEGGTLQIPYYPAGGSMGPACFNPGTVTVKAGGTFINSLNSNYWYNNPTTPNLLAVLAGGTVEANSSAPQYPPLAVNEGTFVYSRSSSDQQVFDIDYHNLELRNSTAGARKIWTLGADRTVAGVLLNHYNAQTVIAADAARTLVIGGALHLTTGAVDVSDSDVAFTLADGALVRVATGALVGTPLFAGVIDVEYTSTVARIATGPELPAAAGVLRNLTLAGNQGVDLTADVTVEGACTIAAGNLFTGGHSLALGGAATLVEAAGATVLGRVSAARTVEQAVNEAFGGIGLEILAAGAAPGLTQVVRTTGASVDKDARDGIFRYFDITPAHNAGLGASVVFRYDESELNGIAENMLALYAAAGGAWLQQPSVLDMTANTVTGFGQDSFNRLTLGSQGVVAATLRSFAVTPSGTAVAITWSLTAPLPAGDFSVYRLEGQDGTPVRLESAVVQSDGTTFRILDEGGEPGASYRYRVDVEQDGHAWTLFESASVQVPRPTFSLNQNCPNPFNPMTSIEYSLPQAGHVTLDIYDLAGRRVIRLVDDARPAGLHTEVWTGLDQAGNSAPSGTYFYRVSSGDRTLVKKMSLIR